MNILNQKDIKTLISEGNFNEVVNKYNKIVKIDPKNIKAAYISAFVSNQLNLKNIYPFCKNPFDFVFI